MILSGQAEGGICHKLKVSLHSEIALLLYFFLFRVARRQQEEEDELMVETFKLQIYSKVMERGCGENMDIELFKLFIRRCSYCYTHTPHAHYVSKYASSAVGVCIVMMFATLSRNHFNREKKSNKKTRSLL